MRAENPALRVIAIERDPMERARSAWRMQTHRGAENRDFDTALSEEPAYLVDGQYDALIAPFEAEFSVLRLRLADLSDSGARLLGFLGVDSSYAQTHPIPHMRPEDAMTADPRRSAIGLWGDWNEVAKPEPYGDSPTFELGARCLADCSLIEDWGCGRGWFSTLVEPERYRGVDGTSPFAAVTADLTEYRSSVPGIFMRGVIEHNLRWRAVLDNALASFTERMALVLFTPLVERTRQIDWVDPPGVPDMSFALADLSDAIEAAGATFTHLTLPSPNTAYGVETILCIDRS